MAEHQAAKQMAGYLYQMRYALAMLLDNDNPRARMTIEKFDDIAFDDGEKQLDLYQIKSHSDTNGTLTNSSNDLWRTLNSWIDTINTSPNLLENMSFTIVTTAVSPEESAAYYLKEDENRNIEKAYELLGEVTKQSNNKQHQKYYQNFIKFDKQYEMKKLLRKCIIIDKEIKINKVNELYRKNIKFSCLPPNEDEICERIEGWWVNKVSGALLEKETVYFSQMEIRDKIVSISREFSNENLPIHVDYSEDFSLKKFSINEKIIHRQLNLIKAGNSKIEMACKDYYLASTQRLRWIRDELLYIDELNLYDDRLINSWKYLFNDMKEDIEYNGYLSDENEKIKFGRQLFKHIQGKNIPIREKFKHNFVMRGSYHILSNDLKIGWHYDFLERVNEMLNMEETSDGKPDKK